MPRDDANAHVFPCLTRYTDSRVFRPRDVGGYECIGCRENMGEEVEVAFLGGGEMMCEIKNDFRRAREDGVVISPSSW